MTDRRFNLFISFACLALIALSYANTLKADFHFDDFDSIVNVPAIRSLTNFKEIFRLTERPLVNYSFAVNYFFGKLNVTGFHLVNIGLHALCTLLVFFFLRELLGVPLLKERYSQKIGRWLSAGSAFLFAVHPARVEAVTYITARSESMASAFYLLSCLCFLKSLSDIKRERLFQAAAIVASAIGMATKEIVATLPASLLLLDYLFVCAGNPACLKKRARFHASMFATIAVTVALVLYSDKWGAAGLGNPNLHTPLQHALSGLRAYVYYLALFIFPAPGRLNFDTDFALSRSFTEPQVLGASLFIAAALVLALYESRRCPLITFAILWYFLLLLPTTSFIPIEDLVYERRMYLAALGPGLITLLALGPLPRRLRIGILALTVGILSLWTIQRNAIWRTEFSLLSDSLKKSPYKTRTLTNMGMFYLTKQQDLAAARSYLARALHYNPDAANSLLNMGVVQLLENNLSGAEQLFRKLLYLFPDATAGYVNLATVYRRSGRLREAEELLRTAITIEPSFAEAYGNLGVILASKREFEEAEKALIKSIALNPDLPEPHHSLGLIYQKRGDHKNAITQFQRAVTLQPQFSKALYSMGISYLALGDKEKAEETYAKLLKINLDLALNLLSRIELRL